MGVLVGVTVGVLVTVGVGVLVDVIVGVGVGLITGFSFCGKPQTSLMDLLCEYKLERLTEI